MEVIIKVLKIENKEFVCEFYVDPQTFAEFKNDFTTSSFLTILQWYFIEMECKSILQDYIGEKITKTSFAINDNLTGFVEMKSLKDSILKEESMNVGVEKVILKVAIRESSKISQLFKQSSLQSMNTNVSFESLPSKNTTNEVMETPKVIATFKRLTPDDKKKITKTSMAPISMLPSNRKLQLHSTNSESFKHVTTGTDLKKNEQTEIKKQTSKKQEPQIYPEHSVKVESIIKYVAPKKRVNPFKKQKLNIKQEQHHKELKTELDSEMTVCLRSPLKPSNAEMIEKKDRLILYDIDIASGSSSKPALENEQQSLKHLKFDAIKGYVNRFDADIIEIVNLHNKTRVILAAVYKPCDMTYLLDEKITFQLIDLLFENYSDKVSTKQQDDLFWEYLAPALIIKIFAAELNMTETDALVMLMKEHRLYVPF